MKRLFIISTELKRVKGRVSYYISEVVNNEIKLIDNDFTCSKSSNKGLKEEAIIFLVEKGILSNDCLTNGYPNKTFNDIANIVHFQSEGICYVNF